MPDLESSPTPAAVRNWVFNRPEGMPEFGPIVADATWPFLTDEARDDRQRALARNRVWAMATIGTILVIAGVLALLGLIDWALVSLLALPLPALVHFERRRTTTATDESWLVEQPEESEFLVEAFVEVNGVVMGSDRGVAWFEEDAVCFTGQRSWFRLGLEHIYDRRDDERLSTKFDEMPGGYTTMRIRYAKARVRIKLVDQGPASSPTATRLALLMSDLPLLRRSLRPSADQPTTLPPLTLDPDYRHDLFRNTELWTTNFAFLFAAPVLAFAHSLLDVVCICAVVLGVAFYLPLCRLIRPALARARARRG